MSKLPRLFQECDLNVASAFYELWLNSNRRKIVFGYNIYSRAILKNFSVDAIVDDFTLRNLPVPTILSSQVKEDDLVIVCSGGNISTAMEVIRQTGAQSIDYFHFQNLHPDLLPEALFNEGFAQSYERDFDKFEQVFSLLSDDLSEQIYVDLIGFRNTGNISYLKNFEEQQSKQYFESFLNLRNSAEVFYDVGGYDGSNSMTFIKECPEFEEVNIFEPEPRNIEKLSSSFGGDTRIRIHTCGLSDSDYVDRISSEGSTSNFRGETGAEVKLIALDSLLGSISGPTFIKMDIEGGEERAIVGGRQTFKEFKPKAAISVYHKTEDFWKIPLQILEINKDYELRFRHYTESIYETIAYFS